MTKNLSCFEQSLMSFVYYLCDLSSNISSETVNTYALQKCVKWINLQRTYIIISNIDRFSF